MTSHFDGIIIGGGASGLMCAAVASQRGRKILVIEHNKKNAMKVLISGGGRCNFTNQSVSHKNYFSQNPNFSKFVLGQYKPQDFIQWVDKHKIKYHEKTLGQLFCDKSSKEIKGLLEYQCEKGGAQLFTDTKVINVNHSSAGFSLETTKGNFTATKLVIATGGLSFPKLGASPFGYNLAKKWGHNIVPTEPALVPFNLSKFPFGNIADLAGISAFCSVKCQKQSFRENILFTHRGLSGPAILQASLYWKPGQFVEINLLPDLNLREFLSQEKQKAPKTKLLKLLKPHLSGRLVEMFVSHLVPKKDPSLEELSKKEISLLSTTFNHWQALPSGTEGYKKAEATKGGVQLTEVSSKTLESKKVSGLYFVGEVLDVTGWLGGYNFQWAWASGYVAAQNI